MSELYNIQRTATMEVVFDTRVEDVITFLSVVPAGAKVSIESSPYYNQFDQGYNKIKATWYD